MLLKRFCVLIFLMAISLSFAGEEAVKSGVSSEVSNKFIKEIETADIAGFNNFVETNSDVINGIIEGRPALFWCISKDKPDKFRQLLSHGANVNVKDNRGRTALIYAAYELRPEFVKIILSNPNFQSYLRDDSGRDALDYVNNFDLSKAEEYKRLRNRDETSTELLSAANTIKHEIERYRNNAVISEDMVLDVVPKSLHKYVKMNFLGRALWQYVAAFIIIILVLLVNAVAMYQIRKTSEKLDSLEANQRKSFIGMSIMAGRRAFKFVTWAFGLYFVVMLITPFLLDSMQWMMGVLFSIAFALFVYDYAEVFEYYLAQWASKTENTLDDTLVLLFRRAIRIMVVVVAVLHIYQAITNNPITTIIAGLGIGGMAVALAATDTLKNFIGFIMIILDKPFAIGERISFDGHDGTIEMIGLRTTKMRRLDGHEVSIPNSKAVDSVLHNVGRRIFLKRTISVTVTYDTPVVKVEKALQIVKDILDNHKGMRESNPPRVYFAEMNSDNLEIKATYWYFPADDWWGFCELNEYINFELMKRFEAEGIDFAFPTQTVYLADDPNRRLTIRNEDIKESTNK